jgi:hypothetical protein
MTLPGTSDSQPARDERLDASVKRTDRGIEPQWPTEHWWCLTCGEGSESDPCQFCGNTIERYQVILVSEHEAALAAARQVDEAMVERALRAYSPTDAVDPTLRRTLRQKRKEAMRAALLAALNSKPKEGR